MELRNLPGFTSDEIGILQNFHTHTLSTLGTTSVQTVIRCSLAATVDYDYLKHAVLALAASHIQFLTCRQNSVMPYHINKALSTFRQRLSLPITQDDVDAVMTSCVLLNMIVFANTHHTNPESQATNDTLDFQWLDLQMGLRAIMSTVQHLLQYSSWIQVYENDAKGFRGKIRPPFDKYDLEVEELPENLTQLYKDQNSSCYEDPYHSVLQSLAPLLNADTSQASLTQLIAVGHRFKADFYTLLHTNDLRALLLLAYWLGLMCKVDLWWVSERAQSECFKCCNYLYVNGGMTIHRLLPFPAQCCGYPTG